MIIRHRKDYRDTRAAAYPQLAEQLDALWRAMDRGDLPVAQEFYEMIKLVKDTHPKPVADPGDSVTMQPVNP